MIPLLLAGLLATQEPIPLDKVELEPAPLKLLDGRLTIRMPAGSVDKPREQSMGTVPGPNVRESRLVWNSEGRELAVWAVELFATAGKDFEGTVRKGWSTSGEISPTRKVGSLSICPFAPKVTDTTSERIEVLTLYCASEDGMVQIVRLSANRSAIRDEIGCTALLHKIAETLAPGNRRLKPEAGRRLMAVPGVDRRCAIDVPEGFSLTMWAWEGSGRCDAALRKSVTYGEFPPMLTITLGYRAGYQYEQKIDKPKVEKSPGRLLGLDTEWHSWTESSGLWKSYREAIVDLPGSKGIVVHVSLMSPDAAGLTGVAALAEKLTIEGSK